MVAMWRTEFTALSIEPWQAAATSAHWVTWPIVLTHTRVDTGRPKLSRWTQLIAPVPHPAKVTVTLTCHRVTATIFRTVAISTAVLAKTVFITFCLK